MHSITQQLVEFGTGKDLPLLLVFGYPVDIEVFDEKDKALSLMNL
jgi:hypothetical protein